MKYIDQTHIETTPPEWDKLAGCIRSAIRVLRDKDFAQPIKPYLRYKDPANRIIAMPAYVGGEVNLAGIKWIASFPKNLQMDKPRAHSVTILNDPLTGEPLSIINTALISAIRTAAISGYVIRRLSARFGDTIKAGITGFGPIGRMHLRMLSSIFREKKLKVKIFDPKPVGGIPAITDGHVVEVVDTWEEAYFGSELFITCTVARGPYVDKPPSGRQLLLNVSLRDIFPEVVMGSDRIIVDDWNEVCRESTDIEKAAVSFGLRQEDTFSITDLEDDAICRDFAGAKVVSFHPMGMAVFDISVSGHYLEQCSAAGNYIELARGA